MEYDYLFIILVYKNYYDLEDCLRSMQDKVVAYKAIVVNAFFDNNTELAVKKVAKTYDCDFISIENKGYSYGNNIGITYALQHYKYKYIVVSNPDILIEHFPNKFEDADIIAPKITTDSGKQQNPMYIKYNAVSDRLIYEGFKNKSWFLVLIGLGINKIFRKLNLIKLKNKINYPIYAAHGSFVLISHNAIEKLKWGGGVFDDGIFLFAEEMVLAAKAKKKKLLTIYNGNINIYHKEDGSMKLGNVSASDELAKGNIYYYENYIKKKKVK